ncbi:MAG: class I SAM-dependent methyltransferase [Methanothrix sp.]|nr:class I SAM-dependent methyltransferase [Methanothrix sp.]
MKNESFYRAFEDRFRGPQELIKSRLRVYLPFIQPLKTIYGECKTVDIGCGRGEWLELMDENGFEAQGVDLDEGMIAACNAKGLSVVKEEAVLHFQKLQDESVAVISGFHIIEHIPFDAQRKLIDEAHRVLKPGGLLILETPNPENLSVGANSFYLDPTHLRPVPPQLLYFLTEYYGFTRIKLLRLQEPSSLTHNENVRVMDIFVGISPDYAVVAQKSAIKEMLSLFDAAFDKEYGLTMDDLAMRYERKNQENERKNQENERKNQEQMTYERERWQWLENEWNAAKARIEDLNDQIDHWKAVADSSNQELQSVYTSHSWRITMPLRVAFCALLRLRKNLSRIPHIIKSGAEDLVSFVMVRLIRFAIDHPALKVWAMALVRKIPALETWLHSFAPSVGCGTESLIYSQVPLQPSDLSPQAQRIYADLTAAIEKNRRNY